MEFSIGAFSNEKVDVKNTSKGISIKKLSPKTYENAESIRNSIINWNRPLYSGGKTNKELQKTFEEDIKNLQLQIERKKMLINLCKRKVVYFIDK